MAKRLRSGYTTGACAAAAAKAATLFSLTGRCPAEVEIPFPDGSRHRFAVLRSEQRCCGGEKKYFASIQKDAGDDPDVTNGAEIGAEIRPGQPENMTACVALEAGSFFLCRGEGVGVVTKPGLPVAVGEPAVNPVPRQMIAAAMAEAKAESGGSGYGPLTVTVSVTNGLELAKKTLNGRLGIVGGLSILGTTGIVRPVSAEAWTATIDTALSVARAAGCDQVVLATGRTSEKGAQTLLHLPEEAFVMMGDYLQFALSAAAARGFRHIHLAGMWAKLVKAALEIPQTHVRHGALETGQAVSLLAGLGAGEELLAELAGANTARHIHEILQRSGEQELIRAVCCRARDYAEKVSGLPVTVYLVNSGAQVEKHV